MADKKIIVIFIMIFIGAIVAIAFLQDISDTTQLQTSSLDADETFTLLRALAEGNDPNITETYRVANFPGATGTSNLTLNTFTLSNASGTAGVENTDYTFNTTTGVFLFLNTSIWVDQDTSNDTLVTYNYFAESYVRDGASRSIISLILVFASLAIVIFVIVPVVKDIMGGTEIAKFR